MNILLTTLAHLSLLSARVMSDALPFLCVPITSRMTRLGNDTVLRAGSNMAMRMQPSPRGWLGGPVVVERGTQAIMQRHRGGSSRGRRALRPWLQEVPWQPPTCPVVVARLSSRRYHANSRPTGVPIWVELMAGKTNN